MNVIFRPDKHGYGYYIYDGRAETNGLSKVALFLDDEAGGGGEQWIKFLHNIHNSQDEWLGNILYLRKDAPKVFIGWCVAAEDPFPDPNEYETTIEQLA